MSRWGRIAMRDGTTHVVPIEQGKDGKWAPVDPHLPEDCPCNPKVEADDWIIHNDPERGGYNS